MRKALVKSDTGIVENVIEIKAGADYTPVEGYELVAGPRAVSGDVWDGVKFTKPAPVIILDPTQETDPDYIDQYQKYRRLAYLKEGITPDALIVAMWEQIVEGRSPTADALELKRQAVKTRFPKPV